MTGEKQVKEITTSKIWLFAIGQLGWSLLSGLISNWLVYFYQPDLAPLLMVPSSIPCKIAETATSFREKIRLS